MAAMKQFLKLVDNSLILLDIPLIRWLIIIVVILYNISAIPQINNTISQWFRWVWFRLFYMLMILYIGFKDRTLALLLEIYFGKLFELPLATTLLFFKLKLSTPSIASFSNFFSLFLY